MLPLVRLVSQTSYVREEAGTHRYNVGTDTPKLCATLTRPVNFLANVPRTLDLAGSGWAQTVSGVRVLVRGQLLTAAFPNYTSWILSQGRCTGKRRVRRGFLKSGFTMTCC